MGEEEEEEDDDDEESAMDGLATFESQEASNATSSLEERMVPKLVTNDTSDEGRLSNGTNDVGPDKCIPDDGKCGPRKGCKAGEHCGCCSGFRCYPDGPHDHWVCGDQGLPASLKASPFEELMV